jgi:hypothetical protein
MRQLRSFFSLVIMMTAIFSSFTSSALVNMDTESIDLALRYGMIHQKQGFISLLGPNWIESGEGSLLNVYSPFMLLATRAAKGGFPTEPGPDDIAAARKKYTRMIHEFTDPERPPKIKFAVSFLGDQPEFAVKTKAHIEGYAHGRAVLLTPDREFHQSSHSVKPSAGIPGKYEAVNSYYFAFPSVAALTKYELILETPNQPAVHFHINNQSIY